ncbi:MAG: YkgJ family cysteine cluster protein [Fibrobacterota bacterium]|nr:YkgJ family cysteine cluster protein [Fibrobacterota bacterium]
MQATPTPPGPDRNAPRMLQIDLQTRFGALKGNLAVPPETMRLSELAWNAMAIDERLVGMAVASEAREGRQVSCKKGCGACCRQAVPLSPAEAWMIADVVASMPPERKAGVLARFSAAGERLREAGFGDRSTSGQATEEDVLALGLDYFRLGIPCPFLVDESCSIHPNRPSSCREYLVTSPAAHCSQPGSKPIRAVPSAGSLTEALTRLSALILGGETKVIPMTLALEWARENRDAGAARHDAAFLMATLVELLGQPGKDPKASSC